MAPVEVPTGADLAAYMGRSDPGDFDDQVAAAMDYVSAVCVVDPFTTAHHEAVLSTAAAQVEARGYRGGVQMTDFGPAYARRKTTAMERLMVTHGVGGFA